MGWEVVPIQPNTKLLVPGFGIHQNKVGKGEPVKFWFTERGAGLGVVAPANGFVLDFDDLEIYYKFCQELPALAKTYTESTPHSGRHMFFRSSDPIPPGLVLVPGIEIKRLVVVYPSKVEGLYYRILVNGDILYTSIRKALGPFLAKGGDKEQFPPKAARVGLPVGKLGGKNGDPGLIEQLKATWPILNYLAYFEPHLILTGRGRWFAGRCPWHPDHRPSLWVDAEKDLWGCHACGAHGDILNWHARRLETDSIGKAMRDLLTYRVEVADV
jgi:hypothetical protein